MGDSSSHVSFPPIHPSQRKMKQTVASSSSKSITSQSQSSLSNVSNKTLFSEEEKFKPLAAERWNVQKKKLEQNQLMKEYYDSFVTKCRNLENATNKKVSELYNQIYYELKWSNPPVSNPHGKFILNYCKHVIKYGSTVPYPYEVELATWNTKVKGNILEKIVLKLKKMYLKLFHYIQRRDEMINNLQNDLYSIGERMKIQNDTTLRFMMEYNFNTKDKFFTLWNLAANNKIRELTVLLAAPSKAEEYKEYGINTKDPDFGLTALHYACKAGHIEMVKYLLSLGADPRIQAPDGRNAVHFAAAYANREILLMLLAMGLDADCRDNYQCTPLDLARQNFNRGTIPTLESWGKLTTMQVHITKSFVDEDDNEDFDEGFGLLFGENKDNWIIPDEYKPVDPSIFQQMSPHLKLTTKRLNGFNPYIINPPKITVETLNSSTFSMNSTWSAPTDLNGVSAWQQNTIANDPPSATSIAPSSTVSMPFPQLTTIEKLLSEVRLCSKHYNMCVKEMFFDEAVKSLKRRWLVGKLLYEEIIAEDTRQKEQLKNLEVTSQLMQSMQHLTLVDGDVITASSQDDGINDMSATVNSSCSALTPCHEYGDDVTEASQSSASLMKGEMRLSSTERQLVVEDFSQNSSNQKASDAHPSTDQDRKNEDLYEGNDEEEDDDDGEDEGPSMSLEKIAYDYLSTASNITYLPPTPRSMAIDSYLETKLEPKLSNLEVPSVLFEHKESVTATQLSFNPSHSQCSEPFPHLQEESKSLALDKPDDVTPFSSILEHIVNGKLKDRDSESTSKAEDIQKIILTKSGVLVANDELDLSESSIVAELNKEELSSLNPHFYAIKEMRAQSSKINTEINGQQHGNLSLVSAAEEKIAKSSNPDYILRVVETFMDKSRVIRLEEYSWRYENKELLDHYTQYSSTASLADNSMTISSASLSVNRSNVGQTITGNYVIRLGYELAEVFLVLKQWDHAYVTIEECLSLHHEVLITTRISVIFQKCDLLLYFFDHWDETTESVLSLLDHMAMHNDYNRDVFERKLDDSEDHRDDHLIDIRDRSFSPFASRTQIVELSENQHHSLYDSQIHDSRDLDREETMMNIDELNHSASKLIEESHQESSLERHHNLHASTVTFDLPPDNSLQPGDEEFAIKTASAEVDDAKQWTLSECIMSAQEVIDLSYILSRNHLIEPYSVAQALSFIAKAKERQHQFIEAWQYAEQSSLIAVRCKDATVETVGLMIEAQRLFVKYKLLSEDDFQFASRKASEINNLLARCDPTIQKSLLDQYWRQGTELISLATIAIRDKTAIIKNLSGGVSVKSLRPVDLTSTYKSIDLYNSQNSNSMISSSSKKGLKNKKSQVSVKYL